MSSKYLAPLIFSPLLLNQEWNNQTEQRYLCFEKFPDVYNKPTKRMRSLYDKKLEYAELLDAYSFYVLWGSSEKQVNKQSFSHKVARIVSRLHLLANILCSQYLWISIFLLCGCLEWRILPQKCIPCNYGMLQTDIYRGEVQAYLSINSLWRIEAMWL